MRAVAALLLCLVTITAATAPAQAQQGPPPAECGRGCSEVDVGDGPPITTPGDATPTDNPDAAPVGSGGNNSDGPPTWWNATLDDGTRATCIPGRGVCRFTGPDGQPGQVCSIDSAVGPTPCQFAPTDDQDNLGDYGWNWPGEEAWVCIDRWEIVTASGTQTVSAQGCTGSQRMTSPVICDGQTHPVTVRVFLRLAGPGAERGLYTLENPGPYAASSWTQTACQPGADQPPTLAWPPDPQDNEHLWSADGSVYDYMFTAAVEGGFRTQTIFTGFDTLTIPNYPDSEWDLEAHPAGSGFDLWLYLASDDPDLAGGRGPFQVQATGRYNLTWAQLGQTTITTAACSQRTEVLPHPNHTEPVTQSDGTVLQVPVQVDWRTVEDCTPAASVSVTTVTGVTSETRTVEQTVSIGGVRPRITE